MEDAESGSPAAVQMDEVRSRARSLLLSSGSAQDVKAEIQTMASVPLPVAEKYGHVTAEAMLRENTAGCSKSQALDSLSRLVKALSILEKYGCNLTSPVRPRFWRSVKHNNPVFRTTVDAIKGGRRVLFLYGYTNQQIDGLSFPDEVSEPDRDKVAAVTLEVMTLRVEVDMLLKGTHPHPEHFKDIIPFVIQEKKPVIEPAAPEPVVLQPVVPQPEDEEIQADKPPVPTPRTKPAPGTEPAQPLRPAPAAAAAATECNLCGRPAALLCPSCDDQTFCDACDDLYHRHPSRASHKRDSVQKSSPETCSICGVSVVHAHCSTCVQRLCLNCDRLFHSHPDRKGHSRTSIAPAKTSSPSLSPWECAHCTTVNEMRAVLCATCERPRLAAAQESFTSVPTSPNAEWQCRSCTVVNQGSSILCEVCERPRLATRPPAAPAPLHPGAPSDPGSKWTCQFCTYVNTKPSALCEMCSLSGKDSAGVSLPQSLQQAAPGPGLGPGLGPGPGPGLELGLDPAQPGGRPQPLPRLNLDINRQKRMRDDGLVLVHQIRDAEKRGISPEEVYAALCSCGGSSVNPCDWVASELPHLLDEICAMAASVQLNYSAGNAAVQPSVERDGGDPLQNGSGGAGMKLSRAEAKLAWLAAGGDTDRAVRQLLRDRQVKMRELHSLGFRDGARCEEALRQSGGEVKGALSLLQRPLLEPFHQRIWIDQPEPPVDPKHPDKQRMCRRLLALYDLPSWGRCELALALLQEPDICCSLEDVVQAVKESHDKDFIRRLLNNECPCCLSIFPRSKMQSLTSCQCSVCHECFSQHFTIAIRDKHIRDMVCPKCGEPDINDTEQLESYFSTLDIQLRGCLEPEVYDLFHKKLTEHTLMKDPKFLWCCHCTSGFINDGNQLKVTCPSCRKSFCAQCKKPWEPQHQDVSCEQFQQWKRDNDPEYQKQGLAGYLRDNGITCLECGFQYALARGGCMHFSCSQCRYQFCSGCNNPYHTTACKAAQCSYPGLHAHHPRDCLFYLRDWEPARLQALLQRNGVEFNTDPSNGAQTDSCGVMEQKDEAGHQVDSPCGIATQPGQAGLCEKHYKEYLVSLTNAHTLDPAPLYDAHELVRACERYQVDTQRGDGEEDNAYHARLLQKLTEVPLGDKVPRKK
ncbi:E3 ubiquitin-protein ligase RNF31-like isoform X2 [Cololabis saira]|uniref:E3 ubiquitin-protein ligase RNF31-like isoform X2 n=1 Tax=Cololabis saira TaxID=129043 RepID=UPI002AD1FE3D|nr:E3 ubiquitin-protein ligase RNF31-like isoform X2 [Cololabis saira]